jgi:hypothetical protein
MEFLKQSHLYILIIGVVITSASLHFKIENKDLKYGAFLGWAENLTFKGRIYFFCGVIIAFFGAYLGSL